MKKYTTNLKLRILCRHGVCLNIGILGVNDGGAKK